MMGTLHTTYCNYNATHTQKWLVCEYERNTAHTHITGDLNVECMCIIELKRRSWQLPFIFWFRCHDRYVLTPLKPVKIGEFSLHQPNQQPNDHRQVKFDLLPNEIVRLYFFFFNLSLSFIFFYAILNQPAVARSTNDLHTNSALLGCRPYTIILIRFLKFNFILLAFLLALF